jgi:DNA replication protein DnaC
MRSTTFAALSSRPRICFDCRVSLEDDAALCSTCQDARFEIDRILGRVEAVRAAIGAGVPSRFFFDARRVILNRAQLELAKMLTRVADGRATSPWLLITGPVGVGKSFVACRALVAGIATSSRGAAARFISAPAFIAGYTSCSLSEREAFLSRYADAQLLVLDDLGSEKPTQHSADTLFALIDRRYAAMRPLVITSNFKLSKIAARLTGTDDGVQALRIGDRVMQMSEEVELHGTSFRLTAPAPAEWSRYLALIGNVEKQVNDRFRFAAFEKDDGVLSRRRVEPWQRELAQFVAPFFESE